MGLWRAKPDPHRPRLWVKVGLHVVQLLLATWGIWATATGAWGSPWYLILLLPVAAILVRAIILEIRRPG